MGFCKKTIGRIGCRGIYADRRKLQNFNLRNGRLEERTKTDAVQEKICTNISPDVSRKFMKHPY
jgi:hypothetical protein